MAEISRDDLMRALNVETAEVERLRARNAELLAALKAVRMLADSSGDHQLSLIARNAIAKAEGAAA